MGDDTGLDKYTDTGNMCYAGEVKTPFATQESIDSMKEMLANAKPELVTGVAEAWQNIHDHLVGGSGSVKGDFDKAVDHILQHWEGESADEFAKKARKISKQISDCAKYANYTSIAMRNAGQKLSEIKPKVDAIEKPSGLSSAMNSLGDGFSRDDSKWRGEIQGNQGAQQALDNHDDDLSAGKEAQLQAAAHMETLAIAYSSQTKTMGTWEKRPPIDGGKDPNYPGDPGGVAPVPIAVAPDGGGPGAAVAGASRTGSAVGKSAQKSTSPAAGAPVAGTKVDGVSGGTPTATGGPGAGGATSAPGSGAPGTAGAGGVGNGVPGGPGYVGQAAGAGRGAAGLGARGGRGVGAGGRIPGGIGAGGAGGAAGKGAGSAVGRGPLARSRGGMLDTPQQGQGAAKQGGQGLHSSRGGVMAGERGRGANGAFGRGAAGGNNLRRKDSENSQGERPDYLVEDEETWMPERRDVTPPTIG